MSAPLSRGRHATERRFNRHPPTRHPQSPTYRSPARTPICCGMHSRAPAALATALAIAFATACASTGARPRPFPTPGAAPAVTPPTAAPTVSTPGDTRASGLGDGYAIAHTALALRGVPYRSGGADPSGGFDCSGLVHYVFALHGLALPRVVRDQFQAGRAVALDQLEPGDLIFFETEGNDVSHVGIAIGGDQFVHAPNRRGRVRTSSVSEGYWGDRVVGARRVAALTGS